MINLKVSPLSFEHYTYLSYQYQYSGQYYYNY